MNIQHTLVTLCLATFTWASALPSGQSLLVKLEEIQKFNTDIRSQVTLTQQKSKQGNKTLQMTYFRRDKDEAFLIYMQAPESDRGNGYLRVGDHMWMYRRNTRTFQHINRDESIGGSDAKADDFESRNITEIYGVAKDPSGAEILSEEMLGKVPVYKIEVKAKVNDVDYPRKIWWLDRQSNLLLKEEAYSSNNTLMQSAYFTKYTQIDGRYVPVKQLFIDEFEKGNKTIVELSEISTKKLDDQIFTKAYLESLSK